jgi:hypothetical protein
MDPHNYIKTQDQVIVAKGDAEYQMILDSRNKAKELNAFRTDIHNCLLGLSELKIMVIDQYNEFNSRLHAIESIQHV